MNPKNKCKDADSKLKKNREQKKRSMQKAREKLKADEILLEAAKAKERQRWHERKNKGFVKVVKELSDREQRRVRKKWRESSRKYRQQKSRDTETQLNTPPDSPPDRMQINPQNDMLIIPSTSRVESGRKVARENREKLLLNLKNVEITCKKFEKKAEKYRRKYHRLLKKFKKKTLQRMPHQGKKWHPFFKVKMKGFRGNSLLTLNFCRNKLSTPSVSKLCELHDELDSY